MVVADYVRQRSQAERRLWWRWGPASRWASGTCGGSRELTVSAFTTKPHSEKGEYWKRCWAAEWRLNSLLRVGFLKVLFLSAVLFRRVSTLMEKSVETSCCCFLVLFKAAFYLRTQLFIGLNWCALLTTFLFLKVFPDILRPSVKFYSPLSLLRCFKLTLNYWAPWQSSSL